MTQLTPHFSLFEMTRTNVREDNTPSPEVVAALKALCENILEPLRDAIGKPIHVSSGYRSKAVNTAIGGSKTSQHMKGEAADFECFGIPNAELAQKIIDLDLPFDQLILEFYTPGIPQSGWIHCSYRNNGKNGKQVLTALRINGKTVYKPGLCP